MLSSSFNLGEFEVSGLSYSEGKQFVLIDMRVDYLEDTPRQGLILNHRHQSIWKHDYPPRVSDRALSVLKADNEHFIAGYVDPLSLKEQATYWGAFQPIMHRLPDSATTREVKVDSGWVVLVQMPAME